jgi:hypothetical protein
MELADYGKVKRDKIEFGDSFMYPNSWLKDKASAICYHQFLKGLDFL